ncbi:hypothetical protein EON80_22670 [bacterium]|nr:MAG: hypothetical protein EON80_22670 [bacterium]
MKPPIADPSNASLFDEGAEVFRSNFWRALRFYLLFVTVLFGPLTYSMLTVKLRSRPEHSLQIEEFVLFGVMFGVLPILGACLTMISFYEIGADTLKAHGLTGRVEEVEWANISSVKYLRLLSPYAVISTPEKRTAMQLRLNLKDMAGLTRAIEKRTAEDNPLRLFLQQRGY